MKKRELFLSGDIGYFDSIENICENTGFTQSKVKSMLYEMRRKLRKYLESEDIEV